MKLGPDWQREDYLCDGTLDAALEAASEADLPAFAIEATWRNIGAPAHS